MKYLKVIFALIICLIPYNILAYSDRLIVSGRSIGIRAYTNGLLVVGSYEVNNDNLILSSSLKIGDSIVKVNGINVNKIEDLLNNIDSSSCDKINITYKRDNSYYDTVLRLKLDDNICKTGLYVKDSITGIGTLTYIDPNTKIFGALGHEIVDSNTGNIINSSSGIIFDSEVIDIKKSVPSVPGEKNARYDSNIIKGELYENTIKGIFGIYDEELDGETYKVANVSDIKLGYAYIKTVISGNTVNDYKIKITGINSKQDTKNISFEIVDEDLLNITGGIVQGMSGSPIIQGDYIIGAVTHVVIDSPNKGYGILITKMLEESEN